MEQRSELKSARLLEIYTRLEQGRTLKKADLAQEFHVTQRSIQRDVEDLRCFLAERHLEREVIYDGKQRGYRMVSGNPRGLTNSEILKPCQIFRQMLFHLWRLLNLLLKKKFIRFVTRTHVPVL